MLLCKLKEGPEVRELTLRGLQMKEEVKLIEEELEGATRSTTMIIVKSRILIIFFDYSFCSSFL